MVWKNDKEKQRNNRNQLAKLEIQLEEKRHLLENEERQIKVYKSKITNEPENTSQDYELKALLDEEQDLKYELKQTSENIRIQELELEGLKQTTHSNDLGLSQNVDKNNAHRKFTSIAYEDRAISQLEVSNASKMNKSYDATQGPTYVYKEKMGRDTIEEVAHDQEECSFEAQKFVEKKVAGQEGMFRNSDVNLTRTSKLDTTKYGTSHLLSKNSEEPAMCESFVQKSLCEYDDGEDSTSDIRKNSSVRPKRRKLHNSICQDNCVIM